KNTSLTRRVAIQKKGVKAPNVAQPNRSLTLGCSIPAISGSARESRTERHLFPYDWRWVEVDWLTAFPKQNTGQQSEFFYPCARIGKSWKSSFSDIIVPGELTVLFFSLSFVVYLITELPCLGFLSKWSVNK
ncbi:hypothetical protein CDAR_1311, partial [Caerostris darwini]